MNEENLIKFKQQLHRSEQKLEMLQGLDDDTIIPTGELAELRRWIHLLEIIVEEQERHGSTDR